MDLLVRFDVDKRDNISLNDKYEMIEFDKWLSDIIV
jgi:hypothetical protein